MAKKGEYRKGLPGVPRAILVALFFVLLPRVSLSAEPPDAAQTIDRAVDEIGYLSFKEAYNHLSDLIPKLAEGSALWQKAVYCKAVSAQQTLPPTEELIVEAKFLYRLLIQKCRDSRFAPRSTMNLGRIEELSDYYRDKVDLGKAAQYYEAVIAKWPNLPIVSEAVLRLAGCRIQTFDEPKVREGVGGLETWLAAHPADPLASLMWQYLGDTYLFPLKEYRRSVDCYRRADEKGLITEPGPVYWRMALMSERHLGDRSTAAEYYTKIITDAPNSGKAFESQIALKRLGAPVPEITLFKKLKQAPQSRPAQAVAREAQ